MFFNINSFVKTAIAGVKLGRIAIGFIEKNCLYISFKVLKEIYTKIMMKNMMNSAK